MCLILLAWAPTRHTGTRLCVAANRDEFRHRPAVPLCRWSGEPGILAGIDRGAPLGPRGLPGTWMGVTLTGRFAALTNVRRPHEHRAEARSRGSLVADFLGSTATCVDYLTDVQTRGNDFNGFNLLVGEVLCDAPQLWWWSNRSGRGPVCLRPGVYGLSNALLDTPWPKVEQGLAAFSVHHAARAPHDALFSVLADETVAPDAALPATGVSLARERQLSARFIRGADYGTRASQVLTLSARGDIDYRERRYEADCPADAGIERREQYAPPTVAR